VRGEVEGEGPDRGHLRHPLGYGKAPKAGRTLVFPRPNQEPHGGALKIITKKKLKRTKKRVTISVPQTEYCKGRKVLFSR